MLQKDFDLACKSLDELRHKIVASKRPEYIEGSEDVLHNFKQTANELNTNSTAVAYIFFRKHVASIGQFCGDPLRPSAEPIAERIADAMNYLELIYGLFCEQGRGQS